ncbi:MAG TPA: xanthine dehydrogenase family protein molybdopterin-binding subunit [Gaiellaceae bacterium]
MARLIRTEKEVEGRVEEVWLVVDEDALEQWPAGPRNIVGKPATRNDGLARARGQARYTADLQFPGMLHAVVLRSPHAHARARKLDFQRALAAPGVRAAIGPGDAPELSDLCEYQGSPVAAVCADSLREARAALKLVDADWELLEPLFDSEEAVARGQLLEEPRRRERGDYERGLAEADVVVEAVYRTQSVLHNSMETHQATCRWEGDTLEVYISTQYVWGVRSEVADALGMPADKVRVVCDYMGGGFGSKNSPGEYTFVAAELARRTGRAVRCALTRREEHVAAGNRNSTIQRLTVGARSDGTLTALGGEYVNAVGADGWISMTEGPMLMLYECPNLRATTYGAKINLPPTKAFRAPGFVEGTFGLECLLDELAAKLELDPLELRRRNHSDTDPMGGKAYSSKNLEECYRRAEPHWERRQEVRSSSTETVKRGVGMASQVWFGGGGPPSYAWIRVGSDARATVVTAMQDVGTGTKTTMAMVAAEELGIPVEDVTVAVGDSLRGPYATLSAGSSTTPSIAPAVRAAAADARQQIEEMAEQRYGKGKEFDLRELLSVLGNSQILGKGSRGPNPAGMTVLTFGVQVAEVAVDIETGEVTVDRIAAIHDVGRVINPLGASSQIEGGIIQGIGHTLSEERVVDLESGTILTTTLDAYKLPTIADVPEIITDLVDEPDAQLTSLGSKGIGEPPIIPVAAAIANAIRDATGADIRSLPISREEMLRALAEAREKTRGAAAAV